MLFKDQIIKKIKYRKDIFLQHVSDVFCIVIRTLNLIARQKKDHRK